jgi:excisionase family DNA binding protein
MEIGDYFFTEKQAAKLLGINRITVWRWVKNGKLNAQYICGIVLIPKWEVELLKTKKGV